MGNVLDCSSDPLDQIHEGSDADTPTEHQSGGDGVGRDGGPARDANGERGAGAAAPAGTRRSRPSVLYLEKAVPLRDSIMWKLQREYYTAHHVQCWERMVVPCFVTSNSFIARAYARVLVGFMRDWFLFNDQADRSEPMLIVEVGSGHGKFAYLVLKHLLEMAEFLPNLSNQPRTASTTSRSSRATPGSSSGTSQQGVSGTPDEAVGAADETVETESPTHGPEQRERDMENGKPENGAGEEREWDGRAVGEFDGLPFRYIITDVAQGTLDFLRSHPSMQSFLDTDLLELAIMDAEDPSPPTDLYLQVSGMKVDLKKRKTPIVAVCNYVFDSLRQDAFRVKGDKLHENRVSITATRPLPEDLSKLALNALEGLGLQWEHIPHAVPADRAKAYYSLEHSTSETTLRRGSADNSKEEGGVEGGEQAESQKDRAAEPTKSSGNPEDEAETSPVEDEGIENGSKNGAENGVAGEVEGDVARMPESSRGGDGDFDDILASYLGDSFGREGGSLLMPLGGLRLLRHLSSLAGGRCLVLAGDKGYVRDEEMSGQRDPHIAYHGSLSCMVNLDALARYTRQRGGWALSSPYMEGFKCQALAFGVQEGSMEETRLAFEDATQEFGPESFSTLQRAVKDEVTPQPSLWLVMQLLRLSQLDPDVFMKFRASLVQQVSTHELAPPSWEDVRNDALAIADNWYPLQQGKDVNFEVARLLMALKDFESALVLFRRSDSVCGEHHVTCHNMGMSYFYLGKLKQAKACFERSLSLDETYEDSLQWLAHVQRAMDPPSADAACREDIAPGQESNRRTARLTSSEQPPVVVDPVGIPQGPLSI